MIGLGEIEWADREKAGAVPAGEGEGMARDGLGIGFQEAEICEELCRTDGAFVNGGEASPFVDEETGGEREGALADDDPVVQSGEKAESVLVGGSDGKRE